MAGVFGDIPKSLTAGARTGFIEGMRARTYPWQGITQTVNMTAATHQLVDLGAAPMPIEDKTPDVVFSYIEKNMEISVTDWQITVGISGNDIDDDQTGKLKTACQQAGQNFQKHINKQIFTALNGGDSTTYGLCYDGQQFFDSDHTDAGAEYSTDQDNEYDTALTIDNYETVEVAAMAFKDDRGEYTFYNYDQLIVSPALKREAAQLTGNPNSYDTANNEINPYVGQFKPTIVTPYFDAAAWVLVASSEVIKPMILAVKKMPELLSTWYDPKQPKGGQYYWKWHARYKVFYGNWRLAIMGDS